MLDLQAAQDGLTLSSFVIKVHLCRLVVRPVA